MSVTVLQPASARDAARVPPSDRIVSNTVLRGALLSRRTPVEGQARMTDTARPRPRATDADGDFVPAVDELLYERRGAVAIVTFNRPAVRNAMSWAMYEALSAACEHVNVDD